ncbi:MAG TPA: hypothetical protein VFM53_09580 [Anaeromyxobacteraceae bacterium]|nr:hypothetical protein [Anaeromyxobacteraceae bacterium]
MSEESRTDPSPFEGLVRPWFLPSFALTVAVGIAIFWWTGMLGDSAVAGIVAVLVPLGLAGFVARPALSPRADPLARGLLAASAVLTAALAAVPSFQAVHPGEPRLVAELSRSGDAQSIPQGLSGKVLLLVSTRLGGAAEPVVAFRLGGFEAPVEGELRRTTGFARVGRGGTAKVTHDHDADWFEAAIPAGAKELRLERVQGLSSAPLRVELYPDWVPHGIAWVLSLLVLAMAAAGEVRLRRDTGAAIAAGAALGFGLVVSYNVTPARPVAPVLWAVVLGGIVGAPAAAILRMAFRRILPAPAPAPRG